MDLPSSMSTHETSLMRTLSLSPAAYPDMAGAESRWRTHLEVSTAVADRELGQVGAKLGTGRVSPVAGVDVQDRCPGCQAGEREHQLPVKAPGPPQRGIQSIHPVCRSCSPPTLLENTGPELPQSPAGTQVHAPELLNEGVGTFTKLEVRGL